jgi:para-nitrobenzyl esterase
VASPLFQGLFAKAIVHSGVDDAHTLRRAQMEQTGEEMAEALGCAAGPAQVDCLRKAPVEAILKVRRHLGIVENPQLFPVDPFVGYRDRKFNHVAMIIGSNLHEGYFFVASAERNLGYAMTETG